MAKAVIHVHQQKIRKGEDAIIVRTWRGSTHHRHVTIDGPSEVVQTVEPDHCGARVTIVTDTKYIKEIN